MDRRHFVQTVLAAGAATRFGFAATKYDLLIKGGRVIDPANKLNAVRDIAIANGKIVSVAARISGSAAETIDATGKIVTPGLIDIHTHVGRAKEMAPECLKDGVTGLLDAGSAGADHIDEIIAVAKQAPQQCRVLINIARPGTDPAGENKNLSNVDVAACKAAITRNRDMIAGIKARLSADLAGENDYEVLRRAEEVASAFGIPVMIHMGQTVSPVSKLFPLLKSGDVVTHMYAPAPNAIIDDSGKLYPEVVAARKRGVRFDLGNGRTGHLRWDMVDAIHKTGFFPDTFSTDWTPEGRPQFLDMPAVMSKFLASGMSLDQVVACVTSTPARMFPVFRDRGTLKPGAPADIAVLEMRDGEFDFVDNYTNKRNARQRLFPVATVFGGKRLT